MMWCAGLCPDSCGNTLPLHELTVLLFLNSALFCHWDWDRMTRISQEEDEEEKEQGKEVVDEEQEEAEEEEWSCPDAPVRKNNKPFVPLHVV